MIKEARKISSERVIWVIGNKCNINLERYQLMGTVDGLFRMVPYEKALALARQHSVIFMEASAKMGCKVEALFTLIAKTVIDRREALLE